MFKRVSHTLCVYSSLIPIYSRTQRLPVLYVFGQAPIDVEACAQAFCQLYGHQPTQTIVIISDVIYEHAVGKYHLMQCYTRCAYHLFYL
jgi:diphthamide biosynthesis enzyme Dph1/Dph2-like protein